MLPVSLFDSYQQYSADTNTIATWLTMSAKLLGDPFDPFGNWPIPLPAPNPKGRGTKPAGDSDAQENKPSATRNKIDSNTKAFCKKYIIYLKDFATLAKYIVHNSKPKYRIPVSFVVVLDRAIAARKHHNDWWDGRESRGTNEDDAKAKEGHGHFAGVLEEIREILKPRMAPEQRDGLLTKTPSVKEHVKDGTVANLFQQLELEGPSQVFLDSTGSPTKASPAKEEEIECEYEAEVLNDPQELQFANLCYSIISKRFETSFVKFGLDTKMEALISSRLPSQLTLQSIPQDVSKKSSLESSRKR